MTRPPDSVSAVSTESVSRRSRAVLYREPVDNHLDIVLLVLLERRQLTGRRFVESHDHAIDAGP